MLSRRFFPGATGSGGLVFSTGCLPPAFLRSASGEEFFAWRGKLLKAGIESRPAHRLLLTAYPPNRPVNLGTSSIGRAGFLFFHSEQIVEHLWSGSCSHHSQNVHRITTMLFVIQGLEDEWTKVFDC